MYRLISGGALLAQSKSLEEIINIQGGFPEFMASQMKIEIVDMKGVNCMMCGSEGGKEYHNPEWLKNKGKLLISHIVRCDKCYDHIAQEIWPEKCDCFDGGRERDKGE